VELQTIRRHHQLSYRIIAVCWPHETQMVADRLKDATPIEVGRMTKPELGEILRKLGITRDSVLRRILDQAHGRPAWAARLGNLLKAGGQWNDVLRGHSVRAEVGHYLRTSRISDHAYQSASVGGDVGVVEVRKRSSERPRRSARVGTLLHVHPAHGRVSAADTEGRPYLSREQRLSCEYQERMSASVRADPPGCS
jgi:hypothetical protein